MRYCFLDEPPGDLFLFKEGEEVFYLVGDDIRLREVFCYAFPKYCLLADLILS